MTPLSPLQLKEHLFTEVSVRANPGATEEAKPLLEPEVSCAADAEKPGHWRIALSLKLRGQQPAQPFLYDADVRIEGVVAVTDGFPKEKREMLAFVNGVSLLYGAVREMVLNITARSVHGPLSLPVLSFAEIYKDRPNAKAAVSSPVPGEEAGNPSIKT